MEIDKFSKCCWYNTFLILLYCTKHVLYNHDIEKIGWLKETRKLCKHCLSYHQNLDQAKSECEGSQTCEAVYDLFCDGIGSFCTCRVFTVVDQMHPKGLDCVYRKPK